MDRLYTGFVSSTYLDLIRERNLVANALLHQDCVPLGMEYFPSTGADQWELIRESIRAADFCLFVVAGRFGSTVPNLDISWTQREYQEAVQQGKPMVIVLHRDLGKLHPSAVETDPNKSTQLRHFRAELEAKHGCRYYIDDAELLTGVYTSTAALKRSGSIHGWIPAGPRPVAVQETDFDRTYELVEVDHILRRSEVDADRLGMFYVGRRIVRGNIPEGVGRIGQDFTRDSEAELTFTPANVPDVELSDYSRSGFGSARLLEPRKQTGAAYLRDVALTPPLAQDETIDLTIKADLPAYRLAYREDLLDATRESPLGPRSIGFATRIISYPTNRLVIRVFMPHELGSQPAGPKVGRAGSIDQRASAALVSGGQYREWEQTIDSADGLYMELRIINPMLYRRYRISWTLPSRR